MVNVERGRCPCPCINDQHGGRRLTSICSRSAGVGCGRAGVYAMFVNSVEAYNKRQQARRMSQRPCPRTHHIRRTVCCTSHSVCARTWRTRVCSSRILYDSSCATMRARLRRGRSWGDSVCVEHRERWKRGAPSHCKVACPLRARTQARVKRDGYTPTVAARAYDEKAHRI